jgi:phosphoribosylformylglycinamidine synthase
VKFENLSRFEAICQRERCPYAVVGEAVDDMHLTVTDSHFNNKPVDLPMQVLFGKTPKMHREVFRYGLVQPPLQLSDILLEEAVERVLRLPTVASKNFLITIGDRSVTGSVARDQMVGPWQVPVADVAITTASFDTCAGEAMSMGERTPLALINAGASARMAVGEALTNIAAAPIAKLSDIKLSANWMAAAGHPGEDEKLFDAVKAVGMDLCPALGLTIPVGKDSMSMRTAWEHEGEQRSVTSPLSLIISAFSPVTDVTLQVTPQLRTDLGDSQLLFIDLASGAQRLGGSALAQVYSQLGDLAPDFEDPQAFKGFFAAFQQCLQERLLLAYHDRSDGGLLVTVLEMAFAGHCGVSLDLSALIKADEARRDLALLFNEELGAVVQVKKQHIDRVLELFAQQGLANSIYSIGTPTAEPAIRVCAQGEEWVNNTRSYYQSIWSEASYRIQSLRDNAECARQEFDSITDDRDPGLSVALSYDVNEDISAPYLNLKVRPKVAVLREQGVNGQVEMAAAFDRAGFSAIDVHMSDILSGAVTLDQFKGLAACGGFSYGDVLGAGEGWAKTILYNSRAREQFERFFDRHDSFSLGVCNGCQMLSNLHDLIPGTEHWPRFVRNASEQFEARFSLVQIAETPSILLQGMAGSHLPVAVAHGEGRAEFRNAGHLQDLLRSGNVAMQFVDNYIGVAGTYPTNPNGSPAGITSVCSSDGRVTIMMPHPERVFRAVQNSWAPDGWQEDGGWMRLFRNARVWID